MNHSCCVQYLKDTIQKQFTTELIVSNICPELCSIPQRYNSKAIHNTELNQSINSVVVFNTSKIQFKSNSQHLQWITKKSTSCVQYLKDTIQKQFTTRFQGWEIQLRLCSIPQRYNSKAIHNYDSKIKTLTEVVFNTSKIQFKSNSQHKELVEKFAACCVQYLKDTIQKQFTTVEYDERRS